MPIFRGGRLPHDPRPPRVKLRRLAGATLSPPRERDWGHPVMEYMALNDKLGCCTISSKDHLISGQQWFGQGETVQIPDVETLRAYSEMTGFDPRTGRNDNGATMQESMDYWRKVGIAGYKIEAFAQIDARDLDMVRTCIDAFGAVDCGMWVPDFAMEQFEAGQVWDLGNRRRWRNLGGHCAPIVAYGPDWFEVVTWGRRQRMTVPFYQRLFDESWAVADANWQRPDGSIPSGVDGRAANEQFAALVGVPGPFSESVPEPVPVPVPVPEPEPGDPNAKLVVAFEAWRVEVGA